MKQIMMVIPSISRGGAERQATVFANMLIDGGFQVTMVAFFQDQLEYFLDSRVKIIYLLPSYEKYKKTKKLSFIKMVKNQIELVKPNLILSFLTFVTYITYRANRGTKIKQVDMVRNSLGNLSFFKRVLFKLYASKISYLILQNDEQKKYYSRHLLSRSFVLHNSLSVGFENIPYQPKNQINHFVAIGRINSQKNYQLMIKSFALVIQKNPSLKLTIYGQGDESKLKELINELNLLDKVSFGGFVSDIKPVLLAADAFIMTSHFEGLPNAMMEAMACGLPVISTPFETGAITLIGSEQERGYLVPFDQEAIAKGIINVTKVDNLLTVNDKAKLAYQFINHECGAKNIEKELFRIIERII